MVFAVHCLGKRRVGGDGPGVERRSRGGPPPTPPSPPAPPAAAPPVPLIKRRSSRNWRTVKMIKP